ncbi:hypothetical protein COZ26_02075 [Candidatus Kuenenbacteria bacterium CG_4_10_14_3_um_filter_39_14]|uniref:Uncharacterized protein n=3 Tax=Candidatus Kueneniibacteriota TaxID=1752740 RepID=A0A2M7MH29_9BACT|nr:MAG: hypothetical protein COZ26_02075 [Candidatus Kuenenbacteria bacterium CG_4_10_14_3_um_filter_39_14]
MNGEDQVQDDINEQEQRREFERERMRDRMLKKGMSGIAGKALGASGAARLAGKEGLNKLNKALGKGAKKIKAQEHSMSGWIAALILAVIKDLLDIGTIELASWLDWIVDIAIGVAMFYLFGKSIKLTRKLITSGGAMIAEIIPGLGFLPIWTLAVVYMYLKSEQNKE